MKSVKKRILCFLLALLVLLPCMADMATPASAAYDNTHVNTGDQRYDIVEVAKTQVGYRESGGITKYGQWYGYPSVEWCAVFIGWCAEQAGIPTSIIKKQGWANAAAFGWTSYPASVRIPEPGDVFFRGSAHTGLVYYVDGNYFYTLEGNTWGDGDSTPRVMIRKRELYNSTYTFASPAYEGESGSGGNNGCSHEYETGNHSAHPHKEYKKCKLCGYTYYTGITISLTNCQECKMENCSHSYGSWSKLDSSYHKTSCKLCGKENTQRHNWGKDEIIKEATCKDKGKKRQTCNECSATREVDIPATNQHEYTDWRFINGDVHAQKCKNCDERTEKAHKIGDWCADALTHWKSCEDCGARVSIGNHEMEDGCESTCKVCGLVPNTSHMYNAMFKKDDVKHWQQCLFCTEIREEHEHEFTADCDDTCDECGYYRDVSHVYSKQWESDETGHWLICQICEEAKEKKEHIPGEAATEDQPQLCTQCGYVVTPVLIHEHTYSYSATNVTHLGTCVCGEKAETESHVWDIRSKNCETCQTEVPPEPQELLFGVIPMPNVSDNLMAWFIAAICMISLIVLIILALLLSSTICSIKIAAARKLQQELDEDDEDEDEDQEESLPETEAIPESIVENVPLVAGTPPDLLDSDDTEDLLRRVAEIEGVTLEEMLAEAYPAEEPRIVPQVAEEPEETEALEAAEELEETEALEAAEEPEETEAPEAAEEPEATEAPEVAEEPETTEAPEAAEEPETPEEPEETEAFDEDAELVSV